MTTGIASFISGGLLDSGRTASVLKYEANDLNGDPVESAMVHGRYWHACTIFTSELHDGRPVAIVAGGSDGSGNNHAEIWDYTQEGSSWVSSKFIVALMKCMVLIFYIAFTNGKYKAERKLWFLKKVIIHIA